MKITERMLVDMCRRINSDELKQWDSGLKVERRSDEYVVLRLFRKSVMGRPSANDLFRGSPREVKAFVNGFACAAEFANSGAIRGAET